MKAFLKFSFIAFYDGLRNVLFEIGEKGRILHVNHSSIPKILLNISNKCCVQNMYM